MIREGKFMLLTLMNKNKKVFDFVYDNEQHTITSFNLIYNENEKYAPFRVNKRRKNKYI